MSQFNEWLSSTLSQGFDGSDMHLVEGQVPRIRSAAMDIQTLDGAPAPTEEDLMGLIGGKPNKAELERQLNHEGGADFALAFATHRMRVNMAWASSRSRLTVTMRQLSDNVPLLGETGLPMRTVENFINRPSGIILVTGVTGSGKSTSLASMVMHRANRPEKIITLEDPIEYPLGAIAERRGLPVELHQREIGADSPTFAGGLRAALRQDPDVILLGEVRDSETAELAMKAAETGHLVLSTMHTRSANLTIERLVNMFPDHARTMLRSNMAEMLIAVISQVLVPSIDGRGRVLAYEIMTTDGGIGSHIRAGKIEQIPNELRQGAQYGMTTLNGTLRRLVKEGRISAEAAIAKAYDPAEMAAVVKQQRRV